MPDLRALVLAGAAWATAMLVVVAPGRVVAAALAGLTVTLVAGVLARWLAPAWLVPLAAALGVAGVAALQGATLAVSPVGDLAEDRAVTTVTMRVTSDARTVPGRFGDLVVLRARTVEVAGRGRAWRTVVPVVVLADPEWEAPDLGSVVRTRARLAPADDGAAALVTPIGEPHLLAGPGPWWAGAAAVRASVRRAVADRGAAERELVPALVVGDDRGLDPGLSEDFRTTGLTHLLAVSGTNLTLVVGFLVVLGRWVGVRGRWTWVLAGVGIVGFVLLARTEPSVVRAAAMGTVALVGMGTNGLSRGVRCLGVAVLALLLVDPGLAVEAGFALSVLATGGILLLAPVWRDALARWLPRWASEAIAVPLAAQVACTPVVAAISGQVSLVAVWANLLAAPAVAPATVLGLAGGLVGLGWPWLGEVVAAPAAWSAGWIVTVARHGSDLPTAAVGWGTSALALVGLTLGCAGLAWAAPRVLRHPGSALGCTGLLLVAVLVRPPALGWPPDGWVMVMCDVGQGDALVLRAGAGTGVVVDAGPDPALVDGCLDRLGIERVPLVVLTHFHADHVDGVAGLAGGRVIGRVEGSPLAEPIGGVEVVRRAFGEAPVPAPYLLTRRVGEVTLQALSPSPSPSPYSERATAAPTGEDEANDASVVLVADVRGVRILLTGDLEPPGQGRLARTAPGLGVDVLKVPHHGSPHQDLGLLTGLGARVALVSVGADNDYGHPDPDVLSALEEAGAQVWRTDLDGDVAVVEHAGEITVVARG